MGVFCNCLKIDILSQFHVFGVNSKNLESANLVRYSNIDFSIKSSKSAESWVDGVRSVCSSNYYHMPSAFEPIHQSEELRDNSSLDFSTDFLSVGSD